MTTVLLTDLSRTLASFEESHHAALSIAARSHPPRNIRKAHSAGVTAFLSQALRRLIPNPSYAPLAEPPLHMQFDEEPARELYSEVGGLR